MYHPMWVSCLVTSYVFPWLMWTAWPSFWVTSWVTISSSWFDQPYLPPSQNGCKLGSSADWSRWTPPKDQVKQAPTRSSWSTLGRWCCGAHSAAIPLGPMGWPADPCLLLSPPSASSWPLLGQRSWGHHALPFQMQLSSSWASGRRNPHCSSPSCPCPCSSLLIGRTRWTAGQTSSAWWTTSLLSQSHLESMFLWIRSPWSSRPCGASLRGCQAPCHPAGQHHHHHHGWNRTSLLMRAGWHLRYNPCWCEIIPALSELHVQEWHDMLWIQLPFRYSMDESSIDVNYASWFLMANPEIPHALASCLGYAWQNDWMTLNRRAIW